MNPIYHEYEEETQYFELLERKTSRGILKQAHIADLHFTVKNIPAKTHYEILREQFIDKIRDLPLDLVSVDGDIFDRKFMSNTDAILYASMFIGDLVQLCKDNKITLLLIKGTDGHEADQLRLFYHYLKDPDIDIRIVETIQFQYVKGARILCIPELYGVPEETYRQYLFESGWYDMCFMHGTIQGAVYGDRVGQGRLFTMEDFQYCLGPIISGHVHTGGCFHTDFYYTGSALRYKHGEEGTKGFLLVLYDMDKRNYYVHLQEIVSFRYKTIDIDTILQNDPKDIINYINELKEKENIDFLRVDIRNDIDKTKLEVIRSYYRGNSNITFLVDIKKSIERQKALENEKLIEKYDFILDNASTPYDKLAQFINSELNCIYISGKDIIDLLKEENL